MASEDFYEGVMVGILTSHNTLMVANQIMFKYSEGISTSQTAFTPPLLDFVQNSNYAFLQVDPIVYHRHGERRLLHPSIESFALSQYLTQYHESHRYTKCLAAVWLSDDTISLYKLKMNNAKTKQSVNWKSAPLLHANQNCRLLCRLSVGLSVERLFHRQPSTENEPGDQEDDNHSVKTGEGLDDKPRHSSNNPQNKTMKSKFLKNLIWNPGYIRPSAPLSTVPPTPSQSQPEKPKEDDQMEIDQSKVTEDIKIKIPLLTVGFRAEYHKLDDKKLKVHGEAVAPLPKTTEAEEKKFIIKPSKGFDLQANLYEETRRTSWESRCWSLKGVQPQLPLGNPAKLSYVDPSMIQFGNECTFFINHDNKKGACCKLIPN